MQGKAVAGLMLRDGYLVIPAGLWAGCFGACESAAVLRSSDGLQVFPVHAEGQGGRLLKQRNAQGDRAVHVGDLLGPEAGTSLPLRQACWDQPAGALRIVLPDLERIA